MKFCDKLPKLRKENNLSQELLADRLGVSRQAVSKWESGASYPDMEKLIEICKILNCTLEDLLDDGSIGNTNFNKINLNNYLNDFLKFVTKTYNMFCAMKFGTKIKCLIEMAFITFILWIISLVIYTVVNNFLFELLLLIPQIGHIINNFFENILIILLFLVSLVVFIHLFKIRYLDYYITIFDQNISEKTIEEPLDEIKKETTGKREKIIIRDPQHSRFSFFDFLAKIVIGIIKGMLLFIGIFFVITLIFLIALLFMMIYHIKFGIIFLFIAISLIGICLLNYVIINWIYNFIVSKNYNYKIVFIIIISGIVIFGAGLGLSFSTYLSFNKTDILEEKYLIKEEINLDMDRQLVINSNNVKYIIDNSIKDIILKSNNGLEKIYFYEYDHFKYKVFSISTYSNELKIFELLYDDIKNKKTRDYFNIYDGTIYVYVSRDNYNILMENYTNYANNN